MTVFRKLWHSWNKFFSFSQTHWIKNSPEPMCHISLEIESNFLYKLIIPRIYKLSIVYCQVFRQD